ncbi:uncharacterized protein [Battus philenor]|uniref:uncharacterized protein n=1 Tax=Battus philenor TaxID=42288 RepID=UPI0035D0FC5E
MSLYWFTIFICSSSLVNNAFGHGYMLQPTQRSSLWRFNVKALKNYNDNGLNCGFVHSSQDNIICGVCGDASGPSILQANSIHGKYGKQRHLSIKRKGDLNVFNTTEIHVYVVLTANHVGHFDIQLCNKTIKNDHCFETIKTVKVLPHLNKYVIPVSVKGKNYHKEPFCIMRWQYVTASNRGCDNRIA